MIVRKLLLSTLSVTVLLAAAIACGAENNAKPWIIVSFAGYDKIMADVGMIGELGGNPTLSQQVEMMSMMLPRSEKAKGPLALDPKQPWGAVLTGDAQKSTFYAFLPISDIKPLVDLAKMQSKQDIKPDGDVYQLPAGPKTVYAVQKDKWVFVADSSEQLKNTVADPLPLLGDLPKQYDLAVRTSIQNLPKEYREQLLAQLRAGAEVGMQQMPNEDDENYAIRQGMAKQAVEQLSTLINEMDELLLGWNVDIASKSTYLDLQITAQPNTKLASQLAEIKPGKSNFTGLLLPNATISISSVGALGDLQVTQATSALDALRKSAIKGLDNQGLTDDEVKLASRLLNDAIDVVQKTVETRKTDLGVSMVLDPAAITFVGGVAIADGAKLDGILKQLLDEIKKNEEANNLVKLSDETIEGIHLHIMSMPTPDPQVVPFVGETLEVVVGIGEDKLLFATGRDAAKTLKKAMGQLKSDAKEVPPLRIVIATAPLMKFTAETDNDPQTKATAAVLASMLAQAGDKDRITITAHSIPKGVRLRLELEEGLLKAIGGMTQMMGAMSGQGPGQGPGPAPGPGPEKNKQDK
jgi:hypothetical protein